MGTGVLRLRSTRVSYLKRVSKGSFERADEKEILRPLLTIARIVFSLVAGLGGRAMVAGHSVLHLVYEVVHHKKLRV